MSGLFKCQTKEDASLFDECFKGMFLVSKSTPSGDAYESAMQMKLDTTEPGNYEIHFYLLFYCAENEACVEANDYVSVGVAYETDSSSERLVEEDIYYQLSLVELASKNKWMAKRAVVEVKRPGASVFSNIFNLK